MGVLEASDPRNATAQSWEAPAYRYRLLDVFTDRPFGGNQLAVFTDATGLDAEQMQRIARELNLSECAFAFDDGHAPGEWTVRIFTPAVENPFAGHPTVGAAIALVAESPQLVRDGVAEIVLHEQIGPITVRVERAGEAFHASITLPTTPAVGPLAASADDLAEMLSLDLSDILAGPWAPRPISCGIPYYIVPVVDLEAIRRCRLRKDVWERVLAGTWAPHLYVITPETEREGSSVHARMFPPAMGVEEDPATGSAAAALSGFLARFEEAEGEARWVVEQGFELGRPSLIELSARIEGGEVRRVGVGGGAVFMGGGSLRASACTRDRSGAAS